MDFGKRFATDENLENNGVWVDIGDDGKVLVGRVNNPRHREAIDKWRKPYRNMIVANKDLPDDVAREIAIKSTAEGLLFGWEGMTDEGQPITHSFENSCLMLRKYKDFRDVVAYLANNIETFRRQEVKEIVGNLSRSSPGTPGGDQSQAG